jgi:phosphatidylinositol-3,4,5-trisphosphate 3-phosphatase and dual-specificity protein phosphatase PTEN
VFHCNHGKGRTGTIICCFFLFLGVFESAPEVMQFYALRRFEKEGYGVTQPCQIKYIEYFLQLLKHPNLYPKVYSLTEIKFLGEFSFSDPYIKIWRMGGQQLVYSSKDEG